MIYHYSYQCRFAVNCDDPLCATEGPACGARSLRRAVRSKGQRPSPSSSLPSPERRSNGRRRLQRRYKGEE